MKTTASKMSQQTPEKTASPKLTVLDKRKILALGAMCFLNIIFWGVYEQQGNTLALWVDSFTDRHILGAGGPEMPATWFQSLNPMMIFLFTPAILYLWSLQMRRGKEPSSTVKMAIGCFLLGASYLIMIPAAWSFNAGGLTSMWWLVACVFTLTIGELYLSPVGLSVVTKLAPPHMVSRLMGMWFLSSFFGNFLGGVLGTWWTAMPKEHFFLMLSLCAFAACLGFVILLKPIRRLVGEGQGIA